MRGSYLPGPGKEDSSERDGGGQTQLSSSLLVAPVLQGPSAWSPGKHSRRKSPFGVSSKRLPDSLPPSPSAGMGRSRASHCARKVGLRNVLRAATSQEAAAVRLRAAFQTENSEAPRRVLVFPGARQGHCQGLASEALPAHLPRRKEARSESQKTCPADAPTHATPRASSAKLPRSPEPSVASEQNTQRGAGAGGGTVPAVFPGGGLWLWPKPLGGLGAPS